MLSFKTFIAEAIVKHGWAAKLAATNKERKKAETAAHKENNKRDDVKAKAEHKEAVKKFHTKMGHQIDHSIGETYPDAHPYDHLARKYPTLHREGKLMHHLDKASKIHGYKDFHDHVDTAHSEHDSLAAHDAKHS